MRGFVERHRHLSLLVVTLLVQLLVLAYQIEGDNEIRVLRRWVVAVIIPVENGLRTLFSAGASLVEKYVVLYEAGQENQRLREELDQTRLRLQELEVRAAEAEQLAALLELKQTYSRAPLAAAKVIGASPAANTRTVLINRGGGAGLKPNMAVITPEGVVGKVVFVFPRAAQVLLITDLKSGVGAVVADSRAQGVVKGTGGSVCRLEYVPNERTVPVGAKVLTSGQDQLFPKGLPVGQVTSVRPGEFFQEIAVEPAAHLSRLEHVLVLAGPPETLTTTAQGADSSQPLSR